MGFHDLIPRSAFRHTGPDFARVAQWLGHFDADYYGAANEDLAGLDTAARYDHFVRAGWAERRPYSRFLASFVDPGFYALRYPELGLEPGADAAAHWAYHGYFEGRAPNSVAAQVMESEFHLFQFGKVGSKAVEQALRDAGHSKLIVHLHWPSDLATVYPDCPYAYEEVVRRSPARPLRFVVGVRDPFERMASGFFQTHDAEAGATAQDVCFRIARGYFRYGQVDWLLDWFDHGFFHGIDVYAAPFDPAVGYAVLRAGDVEVFLYRLESLAELDGPLSEFTGLELAVRQANRAADKPYAPLYEEVLRLLRFDEEQVERVLGSRLVRHFYSGEEIERMRSRWSAPAVAR